MKKIMYLITLIFLLLSCDAQIAKNQFEKGDYKGSVKTTIKYISNGKYSKLKLTEKEEILNRISIIDNHYKNIISNSNDIYNIQNIYDAFLISYLLNSVPEIKNELEYLNNKNSEILLYKLNEKINYLLKNSYSIKDLEKIEYIVKDMKNIKIINSKHVGIYKNISKNLADTYYILYEKEINKELKLKYISLVSKIYSDFDSNYRNSKTISIYLEKDINFEKGKTSFEKGKNLYFRENYEEAIIEFKKAISYLEKYSEYYDIIRDSQVYIENSNIKLKTLYAEKNYILANEYVVRGNYEKAAFHYYEAHKYVSNYKNSYNLGKEYEKKSNSKIKYNLTSNNVNRHNLIKQILNNNGFEYTPFNSKISIDYYEEISYITYPINSNFTREILTIRPYISAGTYQHNVKDIVYINEYRNFSGNELGKQRMISINENRINKEIQTLIYDFIKKVK